MTRPTADVVVCGAGIAGIAAAHHLAVGHGVARVVLVDARPPLSLTAAGGDGALAVMPRSDCSCGAGRPA